MDDINAFFAKEQAKLDEKHKTASDDQKKLLKQLEEKDNDPDDVDEEGMFDIPMGGDHDPPLSMGPQPEKQPKCENASM